MAYRVAGVPSGKGCRAWPIGWPKPYTGVGVTHGARVMYGLSEGLSTLGLIGQPRRCRGVGSSEGPVTPPSEAHRKASGVEWITHRLIGKPRRPEAHRKASRLGGVGAYRVARHPSKLIGRFRRIERVAPVALGLCQCVPLGQASG